MFNMQQFQKRIIQTQMQWYDQKFLYEFHLIWNNMNKLHMWKKTTVTADRSHLMSF